VAKSKGHESICAYTIREGLEMASTEPFDVVFLDVQLPDGNGLDIVSKLEKLPSAPEIIIITGYGDPSGAGFAIKSGVWAYLEKGSGINEITLSLQSALQYRKQKQAGAGVGHGGMNRDGIVGSSPGLEACLEQVVQAAASDASVLITGETGTGKELFAQAVHRNSRRCHGNFVVVDCAALPENLIESMLFGHEKGVYTGADHAREGLIRQANGGTLFLDEIGEMAPPLQSRLLRFLQDHKIERLGSTRSIALDVRVVAATNRNLDEAIAKGIFRADLYHRLNVVKITMPTVRERREDIPLLASYFAAKYAKACKRNVNGISPAARALLQSYEWPGNVRELENAIERAVVLGSADVIEADDLPERILESANSGKLPMAKYYEAVKQAKRELILNALEQAKGNYTEAANALGVHPNNLHRLIRTLDLKTAIGK
jgi:two-component system NtrC family response regulator